MSDKKRTKNLQRRKTKKDLREEKARRVRGSSGREWVSYRQHGGREPCHAEELRDKQDEW